MILKKQFLKVIATALVVALIFFVAPTFKVEAAIGVNSVTTFTTTTNDQTVTVASGLSNVTILYVAVINDTDGTHTAIDGTFTFDGQTMTDALGSQVNNSPYHVSQYYLKNYGGAGAGKVMHYGFHGGISVMSSAVYVISGTNPTTPIAGATTGTGSTANPSGTPTTPGTAPQIQFGSIGDANPQTISAWNTDDLVADTNTVISHSNTYSGSSLASGWIMAAGTYALGISVVQEATAVTVVTGNTMRGGMGF